MNHLFREYAPFKGEIGARGRRVPVLFAGCERVDVVRSREHIPALLTAGRRVAC
jgi:hypothetical protein